jgi:hypothetical protein
LAVRHLFLLTIFVSSFLLFMVQPMLAKAILPEVGGAPAVWITSMLFFQLLLLAGYGYAALSSAYFSPRMQAMLHVGLFALVIILYVPLRIHAVDINAAEAPVRWVLLTLLLSAGLPYFLLATNSSILQRWYHTVYNEEPYHLFSASNAGSFLGLFAYPFFWEWQFDLSGQYWAWGILYLLLAVQFAAFALLFRSKRYATPAIDTQRQQLGALPRDTVLRVVFLAFIPSSLFLGTTLYITTDIASLPLLWVIPLALYLLSFIVAFASWREKPVKWARMLHLPAIVAMMVLPFFAGAFYGLIGTLIPFLIVAVSVHGTMARIRPEPSKLTAYFFWVSVGGALGGLFNTVSPYLFNDVYEFRIVALLSLLALFTWGEWKAHLQRVMGEWKQAAIGIAAGVIPVVIAALVFFAPETGDAPDKNAAKLLTRERNFFGVSAVIENDSSRRYKHGTTIHGIQALNEEKRLKPQSYYVPVYRMIQKLPESFYSKPFGVLGLGAGTLACYGKEGQTMDFFEIDPLVKKIAEDTRYFTYLADCAPTSEVIIGDGRLKIAEQPAEKYNLLVLDAFSSDSVPQHLLTAEAFRVYADKVDPVNGIIATNVSNRYFILHPFITRLAESIGWKGYYLHFKIPGEVTAADLVVPSMWYILLPPGSPWEQQVLKAGFEPQTPNPSIPLWTDQYSNILPAINWKLPK